MSVCVECVDCSEQQVDCLLAANHGFLQESFGQIRKVKHEQKIRLLDDFFAEGFS